MSLECRWKFFYTLFFTFIESWCNGYYNRQSTINGENLL